MASQADNKDIATNEFHGYLKAEYEHIAEAHFRTIEAISSFFRYYLLIMSAPITVLALFIGLSENPELIPDVLVVLRWLLFGILLVISLVGFLVMLHIVNLRMDAILYAQTVNAIRKRFYDHSSLDIDTKLRIRVLPQTKTQPSFYEVVYFLPVVLAIACFNTLYMTFALLLAVSPFEESAQISDLFKDVPLWTWFVVAFFLLAHWLFYYLYSWYREHEYLRSFTLGVDIDGVLNTHREHFCDLLREKVGKDLEPEEITTIPLHHCPILEVPRDYEKKVMNEPRYWKDMPVMDGAMSNLRSARSLKLKIHIFSHRPWPSTFSMSPLERKAVHNQWITELLSWRKKQADDEGDNARDDYEDDARDNGKDAGELVVGWLDRLRLSFGRVEYEEVNPPWYRVDSRLFPWLQSTFGQCPVEVLTKSWLRLHKIGYDHLTVEHGNENVADPQGRFRNRFYIARKKKLRFFVEDDLDKAIKLAYICDVVFLVDHPYNTNSYKKCEECERRCKQPTRNIPSNVLRVESWDGIYKHLLRLA